MCAISLINMKTSLLIILAVLLVGCETTPKLDVNGKPPAGYQVLPKPPVPF